MGGSPVWPLAPAPSADLALPLQWGRQQANALPEINVAAIWRIVSEWRWLIIACVGIGLIFAVIVTLLTTPLYLATVVLEINPPEVQQVSGTKGTPVLQNDMNYLPTQYGLLRSRSLAERVAQELNLASNKTFMNMDADRATREAVAASIIAGHFTVAPIPNSRLVRISYASPSPGLAARIANGFADGFINANLERRYDATSYAREFLQNQIAKVKTDLEKSERELVAYAQQQGIINTSREGLGISSDAASPTGESLIALNHDLADAETKRIEAEEAYRQSLASRTTDEVNSSTAELRQQRAALQAEYEEKLSSFKPDYPQMVSLKAKIDGLDAAIRREATMVSGGHSNTRLAN